MPAHHACESRQLRDLPWPLFQRRQQPHNFRRVRAAREQFVHQRLGFRLGKDLSGLDLFDGGDGHDWEAIFKRPCSVSVFRVNCYVSYRRKSLTLVDRFADSRGLSDSRSHMELLLDCHIQRRSLSGHAGNGTSMKIHEYQAKAILTRYGVTTPRGEVAFSKEEDRAPAQRLSTPAVVGQYQIHAGGRGKAGGVKL